MTKVGKLFWMVILLSVLLLGAVPALAQADGEDIPPAAEAVPAVAAEDDGFNAVDVLLGVSLLLNALQFIYSAFLSRGNILETVEALKGSSDFKELLNKLADAPPKETLHMIYGLAMSVVKVAGAVEDVGGMIVEAVRPEGAEGLKEFEVPIPDGLDVNEAKQVAMDAIAGWAASKRRPATP